MEDAVLAVVTNYDFSDEADHLKAGLAPYWETLLIDNSSPIPPRTVDFILPNRHYSGLWNAAIRLALERRKPWLLFVASDVQVPDQERLAACMRAVLKDRSVGIYTPALRPDSRLAFPACYHRGTGRLRECFVCEGFFFLARTDVLTSLCPVDLEANRYGWGMDIMAAYHAYRTGRRVIVDDRVVIYHPSAIHEISIEQASAQQANYLGAEGGRFFTWTQARLRRQERLAEIPRRMVAGVSRLLRRTLDTANAR